MRLAIAALTVVLVAGCGGGDDDKPTPDASVSAAVTSAVDAVIRGYDCPTLAREKATQQENITEGKSVERSKQRLAVITETQTTKGC